MAESRRAPQDIFGHPLLCEVDWTATINSPHIHPQVTQNKGKYKSLTTLPFTRVLDSTSPTGQYRRRNDEVKSVIHWGQRKLLLSEVEFLTEFAVPDGLVVYAGAAPCNHMDFLAQLFPQLTFLLYDPAPFSCQKSSQEIFTDELALSFKGKDVLFISDIRAGEEANDAVVTNDMEVQLRWIDLMQPRASLVKKKGKLTYLKGRITFPVFGPQTTTETRLIATRHTNPDGTTEFLRDDYDNSTYEQQMFYFNTVTRVGVYPHSVTALGLDYCYDCASEVYIYYHYLMSLNSEVHAKLWQKISDLSTESSRSCAAYRTLATPNPEPGVRRHTGQKQWNHGPTPSADQGKSNSYSSEHFDGTQRELKLTRVGHEQHSRGRPATEPEHERDLSPQRPNRSPHKPTLRPERSPEREQRRDRPAAGIPSGLVVKSLREISLGRSNGPPSLQHFETLSNVETQEVFSTTRIAEALSFAIHCNLQRTATIQNKLRINVLQRWKDWEPFFAKANLTDKFLQSDNWDWSCQDLTLTSWGLHIHLVSEVSHIFAESRNPGFYLYLETDEAAQVFLNVCSQQQITKFWPIQPLSQPK